MPNYSEAIHVLRDELRELKKQRKSLIRSGAIMDSVKEIDEKILEKRRLLAKTKKKRREVYKENVEYERESKADLLTRGPGRFG